MTLLLPTEDSPPFISLSLFLCILWKQTQGAENKGCHAYGPQDKECIKDLIEVHYSPATCFPKPVER